MMARTPATLLLALATLLVVVSATPAQGANVRSGIVGTGIAADVKNNKIIDDADLAHRFRASTTSRLKSIRFQQRGGSGYSRGNGGVMRISVRADDGTSRHRPSSKTLAAVTFRPGNPSGGWTTYRKVDFPRPPRLRKGRIYHIVFENRASSPRSNYISVNEIFTFDATWPRQPKLRNVYAVLYRDNGGWQISERDTAVMDLTYANGKHDGQSYIENMCALYGVISGGARMVRERFTVTGGGKKIRSVAVRVKRQRGTGSLVVRLQTASGTTLRKGRISASSVGTSSTGCTRGGAEWEIVRFDKPLKLKKGRTYAVRLSTNAATQYSADPVREGRDHGLRSYGYQAGTAERTTNGGATWTSMYRWSPVDLQFYLK